MSSTGQLRRQQTAMCIPGEVGCGAGCCFICTVTGVDVSCIMAVAFQLYPPHSTAAP